jgi:hypothetical protein
MGTNLIETAKMKGGKINLVHPPRISFFCRHLSDCWRWETKIRQKNEGRKIAAA